MFLLVAPSQSSYSFSSNGGKLDNRTCNPVDGMSSSSVSLLNNNNSFVGSIPPSDNNASVIYNQQLPIKLDLPWVDDSALEMDSEDDTYSDNSSVHCNGPPSSDTSSLSSIMNESISLNERRREILDLSISKIQMMNTSNVAVSLHKSLLIYNMMKSLQRDLDASDVSLCENLIEKESNDVEMSETNEFEEGNWQQLISDFSCNINSDNNRCSHRLDYDWPWSTPVNTSEDTSDTSQDSEKGDNLFISTSSNDLFIAGNIWSSADSTDSSAFVDDYLGMLCAWEDENYNPLTNCNLTHAEIMNMFHFSSYHLNNQLVSQA